MITSNGRGGGETSTVYDCMCRVCDNKQWKGGGERPVQFMIVCAGYVITSNGRGGGRDQYSV